MKKPELLKTISLQIQIVSFLVAAIAIGYIFLNINKLTPVIPAGETEEIRREAAGVVVPDLKFSDIAPVVTNEPFKSGIETTDKTYLKIDRLLIDGKVNDGVSERESLLNGFWRYPNYKKPSEDGTMVVFGHRRAELPPSKQTFYNLDKVKNGDQIEVGYEGKKYYYRVIDIKVIEPNDWDSLKNEDFKSIKLITCTPLGSDKNRIVVVGKMI